jgi:acylphosphatase
MKTRVHVLISGRVQGVSFRYNAREKALSLGIRGWIRNTSNGRVECEFEGLVRAVEDMLSFCREGPRWAKVTHVEITWKEYTGKYSTFQIIV